MQEAAIPRILIPGQYQPPCHHRAGPADGVRTQGSDGLDWLSGMLNAIKLLSLRIWHVYH